MPGSDPFDESLRRTLDEPFARVRPLVLPDGRRFWLKRVERLSARMRLQKGDPARAFAAERAGLRLLAEKGVPVPAVVAEGQDYLVMPDAGPTLVRVVADASLTDGARLAAFAAAGRALALLHWAGMVHGRPAVRDICWDGCAARFIDLERLRRARRGGWWQAVDLLVLAQSAFTRWPEDDRWLAASFAAYRGAGPEGAVRRAVWLARGLAPLGWLAKAVLWLRPRSKELRALGLVLPWLRRQG